MSSATPDWGLAFLTVTERPPGRYIKYPPVVVPAGRSSAGRRATLASDPTLDRVVQYLLYDGPAISEAGRKPELVMIHLKANKRP